MKKLLKLIPLAAITLSMDLLVANDRENMDIAHYGSNHSDAMASNYNANDEACCNPECCPRTFILRADFLWWKPYADGTALGRQENFTNVGVVHGAIPAVQTNQEKIKELDFKCYPGFRLGLGMKDPNMFDLCLNWVHYRTHASAKGISTNPPIAGTPELAFIQTGTSFFSFWDRISQYPQVITGKWELHLDFLDFDIGQEYWVSDHLSLKPYIGLRGVRMHQAYHVRAFNYLNDPFGGGGPSTIFYYNTNAHNTALAIGPRISLDVNFLLGWDISAFAQAGYSSVYGRYKNDGKEVFNDFDHADDLPISMFTYGDSGKQNRFHDITDLTLGLKWESFAWTCPISLAAGWEFHTLYDFSDFGFGYSGIDLTGSPQLYTLQGSQSGNISTQGLTVSATIGY